ncbi:transcription elongation factor GreA [Patescibacteria group bacterium]|nr:transcription elongation factor GreA [Patescibacteria group bacterium]
MVQYFTSEGIKKLKEELNYLKTVKNKEATELLKYARSFGDLKENAGYDDAKEMKASLYKKISELEGIINEAIVYEKKETNKIQIGCHILIQLDGEEEKFQIVSPAESDVLNNKISYHSPLGQKLIGQEINKEFYFETKEKKIKVRILKIS